MSDSEGLMENGEWKINNSPFSILPSPLPEAVAEQLSADERDRLAATQDPEALFSLAIDWINRQCLAAAALALERAIALEPQARYAYRLGTVLEQMGDKSTALNYYKAALAMGTTDPALAIELGDAFAVASKPEFAEKAYRMALAAAPDSYQVWGRLGDFLGNWWRLEEAIVAYHEAINRNPSDPRAYRALGLMHQARCRPGMGARYIGRAFWLEGDWVQAAEWLEAALDDEESGGMRRLDVWLDLADAYRQTGDIDRAAFTYNRAIAVITTASQVASPGKSPRQDRLRGRSKVRHKKRSSRPKLAEVLTPAHKTTEPSLDLAKTPPLPLSATIDLHLYLALLYQESGEIDTALATIERGLAQFPADARLQMERWRLLPALFERTQDIDRHRQRFASGLQRAIAAFERGDRDTDDWVAAQGWRTNFYLQYQNQDDRDLQARFGHWLSKVMADFLPRYSAFGQREEEEIASAEIELEEIGTEEFEAEKNAVLRAAAAAEHSRERLDDLETRIEAIGDTAELAGAELAPGLEDPALPRCRPRVGFVSAYLSWHTIGLLFLGWAAGINRDRFEVVGYLLDGTWDEQTDRWAEQCDRVVLLPGEVTAAADALAADRPDVLIYLDLGMAPLASQLAALRLAPVQAAAWGHPVTSGSPAIDTYFSPDCVEPVEAVSHYTEALVRLPGLGLCLDPPTIAPLMTGRADWGLPEEAVVYLAAQALFKYLPAQDAAFAQILAEVPTAHLVVLGHENPRLTAKFADRLSAALTAAGVDPARLHVLPQLPKVDYWQLHQLADVALDAIGFTGYLTTLEAIAVGLPVVTHRGPFARARQSAGLLDLLELPPELPPLVADRPQGWAELAIALGHNAAGRQALRQALQTRSERLWGDQRAIEVLNQWLSEAVAKARGEEPSETA